jgi:predicted AlkP superfamily phosphohydrolase/phosphomutase
LQRSGIRCGILNFPNTFQLPGFDGYLVPGFVTSRVLRSAVQPQSFWETIKGLPEVDIKAVSWDLEEGRKPLRGGLGLDEHKAWVDYLLKKDRGWFAMVRQLLEESCDLITVVIESVDRLQHLVWHSLDRNHMPSNPDREQIEAREISLGYFRQLDRSLEEIVQAAGSDTRVFMVSDHGFGPTTEVFYANTWLEQHGYLFWADDAVRDDAGMLTAHNMRDHFRSIDWHRTLAYARTTSANGIYIRVAPEAGSPGVQPEDYEGFRAQLARELLEWKDPSTDTPVVTRVVSREAAFPGPAMELAPDLTLTLRDGGFLSILPSIDTVRQRQEVKGTHRPEGVFIAGGPGVRKGERIEARSILDVAPTLFWSLGVAIPEDFEGEVISKAFTTEALAIQPIERGEATRPLAHGTGYGEEREKEHENAVLERLKALGYVE